MSSKPNNQPSFQDGPEPSAGRALVPLCLVIAFGFLFYWGELFLDKHAGGFQQDVYEPYRSSADVAAAQPLDDNGKFLALGKQKFDQTCSLCHQPNGLGKEGTAPPLAGSDWVMNKGCNRIGMIVLDGLSGPVTVSGKEYNLAMVPWKATFKDEEIAAILSYIRNSWGNKGSMIKAADIKALRAESGAKDTPWTAPELLSRPDK